MPNLPYLELNPAADAPLLHFAHANGFPPQAYQPLLEKLAERYRVFAWEARPLWGDRDPREVQSWADLAMDLVQFLGEAPNPARNEAGPRQVIGVGHSVGAQLTLIAALQRPDLFSSLVLIDPPFFSTRMSYLWEIIFRLGLAYRAYPLAPGALNRRNLFPDRMAMFAHYRKKEIFRQIDDRGLWAYVDSLAQMTPDGQLTLRYTPTWEARVYVTSLRHDRVTWRKLPDLKMPVLLLRPEHTNTMRMTVVQRMKKAVPHLVFREIPATTHLAPLEEPEQVARMVTGFLDDGFLD